MSMFVVKFIVIQINGQGYGSMNCHLTIITLIHWIKVDHVLLQMTKTDSWGEVH